MPFIQHRLIVWRRNTSTKKGKDWLVVGWRLIHALKSLTESEKQLASRRQGMGIGAAPTRVSTSGWLGAALWYHPSGKNWEAEGEQGNISNFELCSRICPLLNVFSYAFFSRFGMGQVKFLSLCLLQDHCADWQDVPLGKGRLTPSLNFSFLSFTYLLMFAFNLLVKSLYLHCLWFCVFQDCSFVPRLYLSLNLTNTSWSLFILPCKSDFGPWWIRLLSWSEFSTIHQIIFIS